MSNFSKNQGKLINNNEVKFAGWGYLYDVTVTRSNSKNPVTTSCMTTNQGPEAYNFQPCNPLKSKVYLIIFGFLLPKNIFY